MLTQVLHTIKAHSLILPQEKVVVAVSGGPDSVCLAHILWRLRDTLQCKLVLAHLDHALRGTASKEDAFFVQRFAQRLNIPFSSRSLAKPPANENAARKARYLFLESVRKARKAHKIAVAHHQDDQVETILLHWLRGAGLPGLAGMNYRRVKIIRPLLDCARLEILNYLEQNKLSFRQDASNAEKKFLRNRVRHELLPLLEKNYNPQMRKNLLQLALLAREADAYIGQAARNFLKENPNFIALRAWQKLPPILQKETLRQALKVHTGHLVDIYSGQILEITKMLASPQGNKARSLPGGLRIFKKSGKVWVTKELIWSNHNNPSSRKAHEKNY